MHLQLLNGSFTKSEALDLITQMVSVKIKFHEDRIERDANEEDSKMREAKIRYLQNELLKVKSYLSAKQGMVDLHGMIEL